MATQASAQGISTGTARPPAGLGAFVDRWIFFGMAALFLATALLGFVPSSLAMLGEIEAGARPPVPLPLHFHAALMGSWLTLLLVQTWLMATGRKGPHMQLGMLGMVLVPAIVIAGIVLVPTMQQYHFDRTAVIPPGVDPQEIAIFHNFLRSLVSLQLMTGVLFALFAGWALMVRKRDAGMHKRLMILATALPLGAAIDRIAVLPTAYPFSAISTPLYVAAWITPMLAWDLVRNRRLHRAYIAWFALFVPAAALCQWAWWNPAWMDFSGRLTGVQ